MSLILFFWPGPSCGRTLWPFRAVRLTSGEHTFGERLTLSEHTARDVDHRRSQHLFADHVSALKDIGDLSFLIVRTRTVQHGLMIVGIKGIARLRAHLGDPLLLHTGQQLLSHQRQAFYPGALPHIWRDLTDAGFVSGHAYGKAMRTVKTCVGSQWCRFGVQDSTKMGIELEELTWGSWTPHKFKLAVSGCPRLSQ